MNSEYDTRQFELTLTYDDALRACDDIVVFKVLAREIAHRHGLLLTFMGKPFTGNGGSGLHVNFSTLDAGGRNAFRDDKAGHGISRLAMRHRGLHCPSQAMAAFLAPTIDA